MSTITTTTLTTPTAARTLCFAAPLLPGATATDREEMLSCWTGERSVAHRESRRRHGITREAVWIQTTPAGDIAVVLIESPDVAAALLGLANSADDFDVWFRAHLADMHGIDLAAGMAAPEQVLDVRL
jgi:hypothetical protein